MVILEQEVEELLNLEIVEVDLEIHLEEDLSVTGTGGNRLRQRIRNLNPFRDKPNTTGTRGDRLGQQLRNINPLRRRAPVTTGSGTRSAITFDAIKNAISRGKFGVNQLKQLARPILKPLQAVLKKEFQSLVL